MSTNTAPRGLSVNEAATYAGLSRATLYRLSARGTLPIRRIGGRSVVLRDDLDRLLEAAPSVAPSNIRGQN